jgi:hypothetical protein
MDTNWAADHLQTIRTLMERSAVYRRALAPIMIFNGVAGLAAAGLGVALGVGTAQAFILFWFAVAGFAMAGSLLLVRRQALKESEPFWSPPTRRVTQATLPSLSAGFILGLFMLSRGRLGGEFNDVGDIFWLPAAWVVLYGCAFHAAGFFLPRGMKIFGWAFVLAGCALGAVDAHEWGNPTVFAHGVMGFFFGLMHLAYGIYLYFTEQRGNET